MRMLRVAERTGRIVHRTDDITGEGQCGIMTGSLIGEGSDIVIPLSTIDALCTHQVGPCALPATGYRSTVEVDEQVVAGSTLQQVELEVHILLVITGEEVNLHTSHTDLLTPGKLTFAVFGLVETELRGRSTIDPPYRRVVPDERLDTLRLGIGYGILDGLALVGGQLVHIVPLGIDEHVGQTECLCHVYIFLDDVEVVGAMVVSPVNPRHHTGAYPTGVGNLSGGADISNQR